MYFYKYTFSKFFLTIISLAYLVFEAKSQQCRRFVCGELSNNLCLSEDNSTSPSTITGRVCRSEDQYCPTYTLDTQGKATCQVTPTLPIKQYPGGSCVTDSECLFGLCKNSTCSGIPDGEKCEDQRCYFNRACYILSPSALKTCNKLRNSNDACIEDYECPFNFGCFKGVCTSYHSLPEGTDVNSSLSRSFYSFCKSGFDLNGVCATISNLDENGRLTNDFVRCSANKECKYILGNGTTITKSDVCDKCGKSRDGFIYCPVYGGNHYSRYVSYINNTLSDPNYSAFCNTIERRGICNYHKKNSDKFKELIQTISTYEVRKQYSQEFANADDCILQVYNRNFNPKIDNPIGPVPPVDQSRCPVFKCDSTDKSNEKTCAATSYDPFNKRLNISLFSKSCSWDKEICNFPRSYNTTIETWWKCIDKPKVRIGKQYPGEPCNEDSDCYAVERTDLIGICGNKTKLCLGKERGDTCSSTEQCVKGLFCRKGELKSTCEYQLGRRSNCSSSFECANNLACVNNTCQDSFYSLNIGDVISSDYDLSLNPKLFCKTRLVVKSASDGKLRCAGRNHTDAKNSSENDFVRCEYNQLCNYTISDHINTFPDQLPCECGFNKYGQGYCKRGHDSSKQI